jgi:hypothetical protein
MTQILRKKSSHLMKIHFYAIAIIIDDSKDPI